MAEGHLRFRCYRCNQLLGASSRRSGTVTECPRCGAELWVPMPEEPATSAATTATDAPSPPPSRGMGSSAAVKGTSGKASSFMEETAAAIPDELAALRPEDIRVEAEFANRNIKTREPEAHSAPTTLQTIQTAQPVPMPRPVETPPQAPVRPDPPLQGAVEQGQPATVIDTTLSAIRVEPPSILPPGRDIRPVKEVVLQPATVLAWSLLVLMALPMAFLAGLLIGHFVWK